MKNYRGIQLSAGQGNSILPPSSLTYYYGLRKIGVLGQAGAHKVMLMAAIAFNLKKYLKKGGRKPSYTFFKVITDTLQRHLIAFSVRPINQYQFS